MFRNWIRYRGPASAEYKTSADARCEDLEEGRLDALLAMLGSHAATCENARKCAHYIERNRKCLRHPDLRKAVLSMAAGVVESGCKLAVGIRPKGAGMPWTTTDGNAIIPLGC